MSNYFESPFKGITLDKQVTHPNIQVGRYSYYSGYYHGHSFDECARYLPPDEGVDRLIVGSFCSIGSGAAFIMAGNQGHRNEWVSTFPFYWMPEEPAFAGAQNGYESAGDTVIGNDVWIGSEAIIMPGVKVGDGAVIGTRALVTRDVEPYAIIGGNPAKTLRMRFDERTVQMLLEMKWWDWSTDQLKDVMPLMTSGNVQALYVHWQNVVRRA
ncbi:MULTISPECIES: type B chloramphenicol O-acetyltransferase [Pseudomonas]|uniref:Chloramphenicol acetyltransferase n=1 Tax=Pseudomonas sessilinigenes TaxID=658629 RepID=A0ABX8MI64_9PSED|nr:MULTISPECIES: type B chloramphenicol O-acetyltransferase [Pseudomonas]AZC27056.1 Chloramphenicol acetyltransferase [Pseudomonas sessilinigenes]QXH38991.1 type B chloramphenicol O-acetyltransferase [Pseudomonas sessilinigenes]UMZ09464.1 type B chloramphenicol O-acetyltransferase [Pseudomonas sp. MPFS]